MGGEGGCFPQFLALSFLISIHTTTLFPLTYRIYLPAFLIPYPLYAASTPGPAPHLRPDPPAPPSLIAPYLLTIGPHPSPPPLPPSPYRTLKPDLPLSCRPHPRACPATSRPDPPPPSSHPLGPVPVHRGLPAAGQCTCVPRGRPRPGREHQQGAVPPAQEPAGELELGCEAGGCSVCLTGRRGVLRGDAEGRCWWGGLVGGGWWGVLRGGGGGVGGYVVGDLSAGGVAGVSCMPTSIFLPGESYTPA